MPPKSKRQAKTPPQRRQPRQNLKTALTKRLRLDGAQRIAVLAVGSELRGDDAAALIVARHLKGLSWPSRPRVKIFLGETAPENLTGEIRKYMPTHLIVIDAIDKKSEAGTIHLFDFHEHELASAGPVGTHNLPLGVLLKYILSFVACRITLIGIQPKSLAFNKPPTPVVDRAAKRVASLLHDAITAIDKCGE